MNYIKIRRRNNGVLECRNVIAINVQKINYQASRQDFPSTVVELRDMIGHVLEQ